MENKLNIQIYKYLLIFSIFVNFKNQNLMNKKQNKKQNKIYSKRRNKER